VVAVERREEQYICEMLPRMRATSPVRLCNQAQRLAEKLATQFHPKLMNMTRKVRCRST
jgi:hypothetical protein